MRKSVTIALVTFVVLTLVSLLNAQSLTLSPTGTWTLTGAMSQARTGAAAAAIHGGAVLVTGGTDANGVVLATAEIYGPKGTFTPVSPMNVPRTGHTATWVASSAGDGSGYVLVTGGASLGGVILASAELYDPTANTWTLLPSPMVVARTGHPATVLPNSSVLLSGGTSGSKNSPVVVADAEQFGLVTSQFTFAGALPSARKAHAAAAMLDGRVLIVGGTDANGNTLASTAIYDPTAGTISGGPALNTPRANATATTLLDGTVLIAGGSYPEGADPNTKIAELQSAEIFDPVAGTITPVASRMAQARAGHQAFLLPNNNNVLLVGGTYNGSDLASSELYTPWAGTFTMTGSMAVPRSSATGAALFPLADGQLLVAGGSNQQPGVDTSVTNTGELYGFATLKTDASDYAPGTPVIMTGSGWKPGETVNLYMQVIPQTADAAPLLISAADGGGNIMYGTWAPDNTDIGARFYLTAVGATSGAQAQNTFTDNKTFTVAFSATGSGSVTSSPAGITCTDTGGTSSGTCSLSTGNNQQVTLTAIVNSGSVMAGWNVSTYTVNSGCGSSDLTCQFTMDNSNKTVTVTIAATPTLASISPSSATYGASATALTATGTNFVNGTSVINFNGTDLTTSCSGSTTCTATIPAASLTNPVKVGTLSVYIHNSTKNSGNQNFTLNQKAITVTAVTNSKTYDATTTAAAIPTNAGLVTGDTANFTEAYSDKNAGTSNKTLIPSGTVSDGNSGNNYSYTFVNFTTGTISKRTLTITAAVNSKTYDGTTSASATPTTSGLQGTDTVTGLAETYDTKNVGAGKTLTVSAYTVNDGNSGLNYSTSTATNTAGVISVASLTITANTDSKTYGATKTYGAGSTAFSSIGLQNGETIGTVTLASTGAAGTATVAGSPYPIVPSAPTGGTFTASNYTISYANGNLTVNPAILTVTASADSKAYGTTKSYGSGSTAFTTSGLLNSDTVASVTLSSTGAAATAGVAGSPFSIVPSSAVGTGLSNYTIGYANGNLTVNPVALTITASAQSKNYGTALTLGTTAFTTSTLYNGDTVTSVTLSSTGAAATAGVAGSPFSIVPSSAVGTGLSNYTIGYANGNLTVNPVALTITASAQSKNYGTALTLGTTAFTTSGLQNGETIGTVTLASTGAAATATVAGSPYPIVPSAATGGTFTASNYTITYANGTLTVGAAPLTITASSATVTYGAAVPTITPSFSGFVNGENSSVLTTPPTCITAYTTSSNAGSSPSTSCSGAAATNYTFNYVAGSVTINKATPTITWAAPSAITYGTALSGTQLNASSTVAGGFAYTPVSGTVLTAGPQTLSVTLTPTDGTNYTAATQTVPLTVNKATPTITWAAPSAITYGTALSGAQLNASSTVAGTFAYTPASGTVLTAGPQTLSVTLTPTDGTNYNTATQTVSLTVNKATPTITWSTPSAITYGTALSGTQLNASSTIAGAFAYTPASGTVLTAGPQTLSVTLTPTDGTNYNTATQTVSLTVNSVAASVTPNAASKVYGTSDPGLTGNLSGFLPADGITASYTRTPGEAAGGSYTISAVLSDPNNKLTNYSVTSNTAAFTISKATASVTPNAATKVYNTSDPALSGTLSGFLSTDGVSATYSRISGETVAGSPYTISATLIPTSVLGNYNIAYNTAPFTITQAPVTVSLSNMSQTYTGSAEAPTVSTLPTGVLVTPTYTGLSTSYGPDTNPPTAPGTYTVTATVMDPNYSGGTSGTFTIGQLDPALNLGLLSGMPEPSPYGTMVYFNLATSKSPCPTGSVQFYVDNATSGSPVALSGTSCTQPVQFQIATLAPASHTVYAVYSGDAYYLGATSGTVTHGVSANTTSVTLAASATRVNAGTPITFTATVNPNSLDPSAQAPAGTVTFFDQTIPIGSSALSGGSPDTAVLTTTLSAGSHNITASFADGDNLFVGSSSDVKTEAVDLIVPTINWTPSPTEFVYGVPLGDSQLKGAAAVDATNNNNPVAGGFSYNFASGTVLPAGTVNLIATFTPTDTATYSSASASVTLTVDPAILTVTADNFSINYGSALPTFTYQSAGFVNGDVASIVTGQPVLTTTASTSSPAGNYPINIATGTLAAPNYALQFVNGTLAVTQATVTVTASSTSVAYGAAIPTITASYNGFVNGDTSSVVTTPPVCTTAYTPTSLAGTSPATSCSGAAATNYTFNYVPGSVTVAQAAQATLSVTGVPTAAQAFGANFTVGSTGGSGTGAVTFSATGACSNTGATVTMTSGSGICSVTATKAADTNYSIASSAAATVSATTAAQAALSVTGVPASAQTYGASFTVGSMGGSGTGAVTFSATGACSNSGPTVAITSGTGTCSVTATKSADANYSSTTSAAGTVTVVPAVLTVTANNQSRGVGVANPALTGAITGFVTGDSLSVVSGAAACTTTASISSPVGSYPITCTRGTLAASNYMFSFVAGTLNIVTPDFAESGVTVTGALANGGTVQVADTVTNNGALAPLSTTYFYLATTSGAQTGTYLGSRNLAVLAAGASSSATTNLTLSTGLYGTYYVVACANSGNSPFAETNRANNCLASAAISIAAADVAESGVSVTGTLASGGTVQVTDTVSDSALGATPASTTYFYLATTSGAQTGTYLGNRNVASLAAGASNSATTNLILPMGITGTYYVIACANSGNTPFVETNKADNCYGSAALAIASADVTETGVTVTGTQANGGAIQVADTVTSYIGASPASTTYFYLATTSGAQTGTYLGSRNVANLAVGTSSSATTNLVLPTGLSGTYYVVACANSGNNPFAETNKTNNCFGSSAMTIASADLGESVGSVTGTLASGGTIHVTDTTTDSALGATPASSTYFYLATTSGAQTGTYLGNRSVASLAPGASSSATTSLVLPTGLHGTYYIVACANSGNTAFVETNKANNCSPSGALAISH